MLVASYTLAYDRNNHRSSAVAIIVTPEETAHKTWTKRGKKIKKKTALVSVCSLSVQVFRAVSSGVMCTQLAQSQALVRHISGLSRTPLPRAGNFKRGRWGACVR